MKQLFTRKVTTLMTVVITTMSRTGFFFFFPRLFPLTFNMSYLLCVRKIVGEKLSILLPAILNSGKKKKLNLLSFKQF